MGGHIKEPLLSFLQLSVDFGIQRTDADKTKIILILTIIVFKLHLVLHEHTELHAFFKKGSPFPT